MKGKARHAYLEHLIAVVEVHTSPDRLGINYEGAKVSFNGYSAIIHGLTLFPLSKVLPGGSRPLDIIRLAQMQEEVHGRPLLGLPQLVLPISTFTSDRLQQHVS